MITAEEMRKQTKQFDHTVVLADIEKEAKAQASLGYTEVVYNNLTLLQPSSYSEADLALFVKGLVDKLVNLGYTVTRGALLLRRPIDDELTVNPSNFNLVVDWEKRESRIANLFSESEGT